MGWIFSIGLFLSYILGKGDGNISLDTMVMASAIFAVAGALGSVSARIGQFKNNNQENNRDA